MILSHGCRAALAALLALWCGSAVAQDPDLPLTGASLFGSLPEPPTERAVVPIADPANPAATTLQAPAEATAPLPKDARGKVDWARALAIA